VYDSPRGFRYTNPVQGSGTGHFCGTPDNFLNGTKAANPPVVVLSTGYPTCCPIPLVGGGIVYPTEQDFIETCCLVQNGPFSGKVKGWNVSLAHTVTNSVLLVKETTLTTFEVLLWSQLWDVQPLNEHLSIGTTPFGTDIFSGLLGVGWISQGVTPSGYQLQAMIYTLPGLTLPAGTYWFSLFGFEVTVNGPTLWDQNSGWAMAESSDAGSIPSESWCLRGEIVNTVTVNFDRRGLHKFTWPEGVTKAHVSVWGGGGGGGTDPRDYGPGGGGGGPGAQGGMDVTIGMGATITFSVGAGGASITGTSSGEFGNGTGFTGEGSWVSIGGVRIVTVAAGVGGGGARSSGAGGSGGAAATAVTGGTTQFTGSSGESGSASSPYNGGNGGNAPGGAVGGQGGNVSVPQGTDGAQPGAGGGGGLGAAATGTHGDSGKGGVGRGQVVYTP
jgi:hypothetical protein